MSGFSYLDVLRLAMPETVVVVTAFLVLAVDLLILRECDFRWRAWMLALIAIFGSVASTVCLLAFPQHGNLLAGVYVADPLTAIAKTGILAMAAVAVLLSLHDEGISDPGEYLALVLMSAAGMMFLVSAENLLMLFVALELTSLSLYILSALDKTARSTEAALKYFLFGGMSAAFTLFGLSLVYGFSGASTFQELSAWIQTKGPDPLLLLGLIMAVIGFGFKIAAAPFHLWAPDTYQTAPIPSATLIASGSKIAGFIILAKLMITGFAGAEGSAAWGGYKAGWAPLIAILSLLSMLIGNLLAIVQSSVRRLIAYSAIAHAGYALLGIIAGTEAGQAALVYYVLTYGLTVAGAFGVVGIVRRRAGELPADEFHSFAGLSRSQPLVAACMLVFMLSLAGIPPLAGFFGKFYVFAAALQKDMGLLWLVILALAMSAVSLFYYLQVLKQVYVVDSPAGSAEWRVPFVHQVTLAVLAAGVVLLGCFPNALVGWIAKSILH